MSRKALRRWWGLDRTVSIGRAVADLLDHVEEEWNADPPPRSETTAANPPLSTGVDQLDEVLDGGVWRGTVTVIESEPITQSNALLYTIARQAPCQRVIATDQILPTTAWLLAGSTGIPAVSIIDGDLSTKEWTRLTNGIDRLCRQKLRLSTAGTLDALAATLKTTTIDLLLVNDATRFGSPLDYLPQLEALARTERIAVVTTTTPLGELPDGLLDDGRHVHMASFNLGGNARLVCVDEEEMLVASQVTIEPLCGTVR